MSDNEHKSPDSELASYLDGSDGVSRAYARLDQPEPPAALDARILAAARAGNPDMVNAARPASRATAPRWRGATALAASLVVGVVIGTQVPRSAVVPLSSSDVAMEKASLPQATAPMAEVAEFAVAAEAAAPAPAPALPVPQGIQAQRAVADRAAEAPAGAVTGARIQQRAFAAAPPPAAEPEYRRGVLLWLQEIARLQAQVEAGEPVQARLDDERTRFTARYPDIDLALELENLAQVSGGN